MTQVTSRKDRRMTARELTETYRLRPAVMDDLPAVVELGNVCDRALIGRGMQHATKYRTQWNAPHFDFATDSLVVALEDGSLVAASHVAIEPPFVDARLHVRVHPEHRGRGLGEHLVRWGEEQARRVTANAPQDTKTVVETGVLAEDEDHAAKLRAAGFSVSRYFVRMEIELDHELPAFTWPDGLELRPVDRALHDRQICLASEEAFCDHWGWIVRPDEEAYQRWCRWMDNDDRLDPSLWFVAWDGDQVAGMSICWGDTPEDPDCGYVGILCVRRAWRGRGLGMALLRHSFDVFRRRGRMRVALHADGENLTGALRLYRSAGMEVDRRFDLYEKELRAGRDLRVASLDH
jgi:mycothiol synthase